ncbi:MAG TPA: hypothetical protein VHN14_21000 [Kofleriaceae bacterium]|jgi:hypothetical protein|nr:hypothetical protein [Kofleriaceae bacterium]
MRLSTNFSILLLSTSLALFGCKKKDNAAAPPTESNAMAKPGAPAGAPAPAAPAGGATIASDEDYVKTGTAMLDKMVGIFKGAGTNCDKLADDITKMATENDAIIKASEAYEKAHPDAKTKFEAATKDQMKSFEEVAGAAISACKDSKKLQEAMTKLAPG